MGQVAPIAPRVARTNIGPARIFLGTFGNAQAKCEYCGRYGVLGQCEGCGAAVMAVPVRLLTPEELSAMRDCDKPITAEVRVWAATASLIEADIQGFKNRLAAELQRRWFPDRAHAKGDV